MNVLYAITRMIEPVQRRVMLTIGRGIIKLVKDGGGIQQLQVALMAEELADGVPRIQEYGFTSNPLPGAEAVTVSLGGNRDHTVVIAVDDRRYRFRSLGSGEVALYSHEGTRVVLRNGGKVEVRNQTDELMTVLSDLMQWIIDARVETALGPRPLLLETDLTALPDIKQRLDTFKV